MVILCRTPRISFKKMCAFHATYERDNLNREFVFWPDPPHSPEEDII